MFKGGAMCVLKGSQLGILLLDAKDVAWTKIKTSMAIPNLV